MIEKRLTWISKIFDGFGDDVSERVVTRLPPGRTEGLQRARRCRRR